MKLYQFIIYNYDFYDHDQEEPATWFISDLYTTKSKAEKAAKQKVKEMWCEVNDRKTYDRNQQSLDYAVEERAVIS
jgi:hypothetical protein